MNDYKNKKPIIPLMGLWVWRYQWVSFFRLF